MVTFIQKVNSSNCSAVISLSDNFKKANMIFYDFSQKRGKYLSKFRAESGPTLGVVQRGTTTAFSIIKDSNSLNSGPTPSLPNSDWNWVVMLLGV